jgi:hypothetical protein
MPKRLRTQQRWEELYNLAQYRHTAGLTDEESRLAFDAWVDKNPDLQDRRAIATAWAEYQKMAHPRLAGWLPRIKKLAQHIINNEPAGTKRRFNHEFSKICRFARDHKISVSAAIREFPLH